MCIIFKGPVLKGPSFKTKVCKFFSSGECHQVKLFFIHTFNDRLSN